MGSYHLLAGAMVAMSIVSCGGDATTDATQGTGGGADASEDGSSGGQTATGGDGNGSGGADSDNPTGCVDDALAGKCLVPIACAAGQSPFGGGDGTAESPYRICSIAHLLAVDDEATGIGKSFVLATSLDLSPIEGFVPLGVPAATSESGFAATFEGTLDGAGRVLRGVTIDLPEEDNIGLFGWVLPDSSIRDLALVDFTVRGRSAVGMLAGRCAGDVISVHTSGSVEAAGTAGGVVGHNWGSMSHSSSSATVTASSVAGGLIGSDEGDVSECESSGSIFGDLVAGGLVAGALGTIADSRSSANVQGRRQVGGLVGHLNGGTVLRGEASGSVSGAANQSGASSSVGGLIGWVQTSFASVLSSRATGAVQGTESVGGLIGSTSDTTVEDCEASGTVQGTSAVGGLIGGTTVTRITRSRASGAVYGVDTVGGLIGLLDRQSSSSNSLATGDVTGSGSLVGGLVGRMGAATSVRNSYSVGQVVGSGEVGGLVGGGAEATDISHSYAFGLPTGAVPIGGLVGSASIEVITSYYREEAPAGPPDKGTPLSLTRFGSQINFVDWDFASTWVMSESLGRPVLSWE